MKIENISIFLYSVLKRLIQPFRNQKSSCSMLVSPCWKPGRNLSLESTSPAPSESASTSESRQVSITLPKIELLRFSGNYTEWLTFWQNCLSHVHTNSDIPIISKFTYLIGFLDGEAKDVIKGYTPTVNLLSFI